MQDLRGRTLKARSLDTLATTVTHLRNILAAQAGAAGTLSQEAGALLAPPTDLERPAPGVDTAACGVAAADAAEAGHIAAALLNARQPPDLPGLVQYTLASEQAVPVRARPL